MTHRIDGLAKPLKNRTKCFDCMADTNNYLDEVNVYNILSLKEQKLVFKIHVVLN